MPLFPPRSPPHFCQETEGGSVINSSTAFCFLSQTLVGEVRTGPGRQMMGIALNFNSRRNGFPAAWI